MHYENVCAYMLLGSRHSPEDIMVLQLQNMHLPMLSPESRHIALAKIALVLFANAAVHRSSPHQSKVDQ